MKRNIGWIVAVLLIAIVTPSFAASPVRVRSYIRKDGIYVQPYYRTAPDSSFYNNWSTKGNFNPYTGEDGKIVTPPHSNYYNGYNLPSVFSYTPQLHRNIFSDPTTPILQTTHTYGVAPHVEESTTEFLSRTDRVARQDQARRLSDLGYDVNWQKMSFLEMSDMENRVRLAQRLQKIGYTVDWRNYSFLDMADMENRIRLAKRLNELGEQVDWHTMTFLGMADMENRIRLAKRLDELGEQIDWRTTSFPDMSDMENRIQHARRLKQLGVIVDWHLHSFLELSEIESRTIQRKRYEDSHRQH